MKPQPSSETIQRLLKNRTSGGIPLIGQAPKDDLQEVQRLISLVNNMVVQEGILPPIRLLNGEQMIHTVLKLSVLYNNLVDVLHKTLFTHLIKVGKLEESTKEQEDNNALEGEKE